MIRENQQLVKNEPVEFENEPVEVQDCRKLPIILEKFIEYPPI